MAPGEGLCAIVLAAGRSTRMQEHNKLLLPWGGKRIVQVVVETLLSISFEEVVVVVGHQRDAVEEALADYPLQLVHNPGYAEGLSTSIERGVEAAGADVHGYLFALGDMPQVKSATINELCRAFFWGTTDAIVLPTVQGRRGNPVVFSGSYRAQLLQLEGDRGARPLMQKYAAKVLEVAVEDPGILLDVDTPEVYRAMLEKDGIPVAGIIDVDESD
jgi:molybdenum cofactor cytidylyltransferase